METLLVGGAVRDLMRGVEPSDRDHVVVGATHADMVARGFRAVGADFPVYLHPETGEEHALARAGRRTGHGHGGLSTEHGPDVGIEEDLRRRDFTINAMAMRGDGTVIDPHGGRADLASGVLRHTSESFGDDPVRVLRAGRLAAKLGFVVAPETAALCADMVAAGRLEELVPERVAAELRKSLALGAPSRFFVTLRDVGALRATFPEVAALVGRPQSPVHHAEGDAFEHTMMVVDAAARRTPDELTRFAALVHDLGKAVTRDRDLPRHTGHEGLGGPIVDAMVRRLRLPTRFAEVGRLCAEQHGKVHRALEMRPSAFVRVFDELAPGHRTADIERLATLAEADNEGRLPRRDAYPQAALVRATLTAIAAVRMQDHRSPALLRTMPPERIAELRTRLRVTAAGRVMSLARPGKPSTARTRPDAGGRDR